MRFGNIHYYFDRRDEEWKFVFTFDNRDGDYIEPWWESDNFEVVIKDENRPQDLEAWISFYHSRQVYADEPYKLMTIEEALRELKEQVDDHLRKKAYYVMEKYNALCKQYEQLEEMSLILIDKS